MARLFNESAAPLGCKQASEARQALQTNDRSAVDEEASAEVLQRLRPALNYCRIVPKRMFWCGHINYGPT